MSGTSKLYVMVWFGIAVVATGHFMDAGELMLLGTIIQVVGWAGIWGKE